MQQQNTANILLYCLAQDSIAHIQECPSHWLAWRAHAAMTWQMHAALMKQQKVSSSRQMGMNTSMFGIVWIAITGEFKTGSTLAATSLCWPRNLWSIGTMMVRIVFTQEVEIMFIMSSTRSSYTVQDKVVGSIAETSNREAERGRKGRVEPYGSCTHTLPGRAQRPCVSSQ